MRGLRNNPRHRRRVTAIHVALGDLADPIELLLVSNARDIACGTACLAIGFLDDSRRRIPYRDESALYERHPLTGVLLHETVALLPISSLVLLETLLGLRTHR